MEENKGSFQGLIQGGVISFTGMNCQLEYIRRISTRRLLFVVRDRVVPF